MRLYKQTVQDFVLFPGNELSDEEMQELKTAAGEMSAKMRAVRIVAASSISKRDLEHRLVQKGEDPGQAKNAVEWMSQLNLVDDRKTAEQIVQRCISKGYGLARAKQALYEKRIPKTHWDAVLQDYPEQTQSIEDYLVAHLKGDTDPKSVKKAVDALLRRGHSYGVIRRVLDGLAVDTDAFPED